MKNIENQNSLYDFNSFDICTEIENLKETLNQNADLLDTGQRISTSNHEFIVNSEQIKKYIVKLFEQIKVGPDNVKKVVRNKNDIVYTNKYKGSEKVAELMKSEIFTKFMFNNSDHWKILKLLYHTTQGGIHPYEKFKEHYLIELNLRIDDTNNNQSSLLSVMNDFSSLGADISDILINISNIHSPEQLIINLLTDRSDTSSIYKI